ncbi:MAG: hypothetical protein N2746_04395 [Deltaproteobacteria bacterium]|nr:hypothetical protein [Deltaproteobacteria bacterium]
MDRHIDEILFEYNQKEEAIKNVDISHHIQHCQRCRELLEHYFNVINVLLHSPNRDLLDEDECETIFENIVRKINQLDKNGRKSKSIYKIVAIAASLLIILISTFLFIKKETVNLVNEKETHLLHILDRGNGVEFDMLSEFELFSNIDIIENLEILEELNEVIDDEI